MKALNAIAAIAAITYLDVVASRTGYDGQLHTLRLVLIAGLGGFYIADVIRKQGGA